MATAIQQTESMFRMDDKTHTAVCAGQEVELAHCIKDQHKMMFWFWIKDSDGIWCTFDIRDVCAVDTFEWLRTHKPDDTLLAVAEKLKDTNILSMVKGI